MPDLVATGRPAPRKPDLSGRGRRLAHAVARRQAQFPVAIAGLAFVAGALVGVVAGDLPRTVVYLVLGVVAIVFAAILIVRSRLRRSNGTLYYVTILSQEMGDQHEATFEAMRGTYARSWSVPYKSNPRLAPGLVDELSSEVAAASGELRGLMRQDDPVSGYHMAPNMLWPTALALGFDVAWPAGTELIELPTGVTPDRTNGVRPADLMAWRMGDAPAANDGFSEPSCRSTPSEPDVAARSVLISVELTRQGRGDPPPWPVEAMYRVAVFAGAGGGLDDANEPVEIHTDPSAGLERGQAPAVVHPEVAARACLTTIRHVLHTHPGALVLLMFRVPKTVALRVGDMLEGEGKSPGDPGCGHVGCVNESCLAPWSRLVPLMFRHPGSYRVARVHDSQPPAAELSDQISGLR